MVTDVTAAGTTPPVDPDLLGTVELSMGAVPGAGAADLGSFGRQLLDALQQGGARSFHVPLVLILAFLGYLAMQRGVTGGPLPMVAHPPAGEPMPGDPDDRYRL